MLKKIYKLKKNKLFFFGLKNKIAKIYIRRSFSNIFITLTDLNNKVIICKTSGSSGILKNKRKKKLAQTVEKIMLYINEYIKSYEITHIHIVLKMKIRSHVYVMVNKLIYYGLIILSICSRKMIAHNGVKGKNIRRL